MATSVSLSLRSLDELLVPQVPEPKPPEPELPAAELFQPLGWWRQRVGRSTERATTRLTINSLFGSPIVNHHQPLLLVIVITPYDSLFLWLLVD